MSYICVEQIIHYDGNMYTVTLEICIYSVWNVKEIMYNL